MEWRGEGGRNRPVGNTRLRWWGRGQYHELQPIRAGAMSYIFFFSPHTITPHWTPSTLTTHPATSLHTLRTLSKTVKPHCTPSHIAPTRFSAVDETLINWHEFSWLLCIGFFFIRTPQKYSHANTFWRILFTKMPMRILKCEYIFKKSEQTLANTFL